MSYADSQGAKGGQDRMMSRRASAVAAFSLLALVAVGSSDILAQDRSAVDQIASETPERAAGLEPPQIAASSANAAFDQQVEPPEQRPTANQLTRERGSAAPVRQLYSGGRTAQPTEALSNPAQGRREAGVVQRVAGADRCDAAAIERNDKRCSRVIEARSAEFEKPHREDLTPEQRLLISQQQREGVANTRSLARRLGTAADPQSIEEQGIVATVTPPHAPPASGVETKQEAVVDPAVEAIVKAMIANAQR
jgi:hypothetical protein